MKLEEVSRSDFIAAGRRLAKDPVSIVCDVGASNVRVGLLTSYLEQGGRLVFTKFKVKNIRALIEGFEEIAKELPDLNVKIAAINIPGPVIDTIGGPIANYEGTPKEKMLDVDKLPARLFPRGHTRLLNDLEAAAYGVLASKELGLFNGHFKTMWRSTNDVPGHILIVAPGTGLGNALLHYHPANRQFTVLPLEFGHTNIAEHHHNVGFLYQYAAEMKRGPYPPEYDDICSGRGLERIYREISGGKKLAAENIAKEAHAGRKEALDAMREFNRYLMHFCSSMGMGFVATHILLVGDNVVSNSFFYEKDEEVEKMRKALLSHSTERMGFMSRIAVSRQSQRLNMNILGCAYVCAHQQRSGEKVSLTKAKL